MRFPSIATYTSSLHIFFLKCPCLLLSWPLPMCRWSFRGNFSYLTWFSLFAFVCLDDEKKQNTGTVLTEVDVLCCIACPNGAWRGPDNARHSAAELCLSELFSPPLPPNQ